MHACGTHLRWIGVQREIQPGIFSASNCYSRPVNSPCSHFCAAEAFAQQETLATNVYRGLPAAASAADAPPRSRHLLTLQARDTRPYQYYKPDAHGCSTSGGVLETRFCSQMVLVVRENCHTFVLAAAATASESSCSCGEPDSGWLRFMVHIPPADG
jgi:hypothetical protein